MSDDADIVREALASIPREHLVEPESAMVERHTLVRTYKHAAADEALDRILAVVELGKAALSVHDQGAHLSDQWFDELRDALAALSRNTKGETP